MPTYRRLLICFKTDCRQISYLLQSIQFDSIFLIDLYTQILIYLSKDILAVIGIRVNC